MRYYHMIIQRPGPARWGETEGRREYISTHPGAAPPGWVCVAVCGYHEAPREVQKPCIGCIYYATCGSTTRTAPCAGRMTKREAALRKYEED